MGMLDFKNCKIKLLINCFHTMHVKLLVNEFKHFNTKKKNEKEKKRKGKNGQFALVAP